MLQIGFIIECFEIEAQSEKKIPTVADSLVNFMKIT